MSQREPVKEPQALKLPSREKLETVVSRLNESARREFLTELLNALVASVETNDLQPVDDLIEVWASSASPESKDQELLASA